MEKSARLAGYGLAFVALLSLMAGIGMLQEGSLFRRTLIKVNFPSVGTLMVDDPIKLRGVEVGRVEAIEASPQGPLITLELYKRTQLPVDSKFINFNYSLFGARNVVLVPGHSTESMDMDAVQQGLFLSGITESIHLVDRLLKTVVEYQTLAARLDQGSDTAQSFQQLLQTRIYPALDEFGAFAHRLEQLESRASNELDKVALASGQVRRFSAVMAVGTDTLVSKANLTVERLATLTAQSVALLDGLEKILLAAQDSTGLPGRILTQRDLYEKTMTLAHALNDLLAQIKEKGLKDIISFWRNVRFRGRAPD
jgi:phospholipid/cholesterol/gamma-HCH transport system substrate-binding protein